MIHIVNVLNTDSIPHNVFVTVGPSQALLAGSRIDFSVMSVPTPSPLPPSDSSKATTSTLHDSPITHSIQPSSVADPVSRTQLPNTDRESDPVGAHAPLFLGPSSSPIQSDPRPRRPDTPAAIEPSPLLRTNSTAPLLTKDASGSSVHTDLSPSPSSSLPCKDAASSKFSLVDLFMHWQFIRLIFVASIWGFATGSYDSYLFLYLDSLKTPASVMGFGLTLNTLVEVPIFLFSGRILTKLGTTRVFHLVFFAYIVRLFWYASFFALTDCSSAYLLVEGLHGITFALGWASLLQQIKLSVPSNSIGTVTAIVSSVWWGFAYGVGAMVGGSIFDALGAARLFELTAILVAVGWSVFSMLDLLLTDAHPFEALKTNSKRFARSLSNRWHNQYSVREPATLPMAR